MTSWLAQHKEHKGLGVKMVRPHEIEVEWPCSQQSWNTWAGSSWHSGEAVQPKAPHYPVRHSRSICSIAWSRRQQLPVLVIGQSPIQHTHIEAWKESNLSKLLPKRVGLVQRSDSTRAALEGQWGGAFEVHARTAMTSRSSSKAKRTTVGLAEARRLWRMQVVICASNCTKRRGQSTPSTWPCTSLVSWNLPTTKSISLSPAAERDTSSELAALTAMPTSSSRWVMNLFSNGSELGLEISGWKWTGSLAGTCSSNSCTHETAKTLVAVQLENFALELSSGFGPAKEASSSTSSAMRSSLPFRFKFDGSSLPPFEGKARTTCLMAMSHVGSCARPFARSIAKMSSCSASASAPFDASKSWKSCVRSGNKLCKSEPELASWQRDCEAQVRTAQTCEPLSSPQSFFAASFRRLFAGTKRLKYGAVERQADSARTVANALLPCCTWWTCWRTFQIPDNKCSSRPSQSASFSIMAAEWLSSETTQSTRGASKKSASKWAVARRKESFIKGAKAAPAASILMWREYSIQRRTGWAVSLANFKRIGKMFIM